MCIWRSGTAFKIFQALPFLRVGSLLVAMQASQYCTVYQMKTEEAALRFWMYDHGKTFDDAVQMWLNHLGDATVHRDTDGFGGEIRLGILVREYWTRSTSPRTMRAWPLLD